MAEFVEAQLSDHVRALPTYVQDTTDFIRRVNEVQMPLAEGALMFCMDVKALYPSVPREEAREAVRFALNNTPGKVADTTTILQMMDFVLNHNTFQFGAQNYTQIQGTVIGSKLGCNYACTYMGAWESKLLQFSARPLFFVRYIDDVFGIWTHGESTLREFHETANNIHPRIQVDLRLSTTEIEFLDVNVKIVNNKIQTSLYCKPTDKHIYLHAKSSHPRHVKRSIPYSLAVRAKRICSQPVEFAQQQRHIVDRLASRGHSRRHAEEQVARVDALSRASLLQYKQKTQNDNVIPLNIIYSDALPNVSKILKDRQKILANDKNLCKIYEDKLVVGYRRNQNLADILVHRKHNNSFYHQQSISQSCDRKCAICPHMLKTTQFQSSTGEVFSVRGNINCKTANLIYGIHCDHCSRLIYVGETGTTLYERMNNNLSRIRTGYNDPVANHFREQNHSAAHLKIIGLEKFCGGLIARRTKESFWMKKLRTIIPEGLNKHE